MSDNSTKILLAMYNESMSMPMFLSGMFQTPQQNFHKSEKVEIDIRRHGMIVSVPIADISADGRENEADLYTNKAFTPPVYNEIGTISAYNMIKRQGGQTPFESPDFQANAAREAFRIARVNEDKVRLAIELQASQVLQTGKLAIKDSSNTTVFDLDFAPKSSHFVTVGTVWAADGSTGDPHADIDSIARTIRRDGKMRTDRLIFGSVAWPRFLANQKTKDALFQRAGFGLGMLTPEFRGSEGATFQGYIWIQNYRYECWTYDGFYTDPYSGSYTEFVGSDKVIVMASGGRLDLTFGAIPRMVPPDPRAAMFLPPRVSNTSVGMDLTMNAWLTADGTKLKVSAGTRPLCIPTAIDTFGCLDVVP